MYGPVAVPSIEVMVIVASWPSIVFLKTMSTHTCMDPKSSSTAYSDISNPTINPETAHQNGEHLNNHSLQYVLSFPASPLKPHTITKTIHMVCVIYPLQSVTLSIAGNEVEIEPFLFSRHSISVLLFSTVTGTVRLPTVIVSSEYI